MLPSFSPFVTPQAILAVLYYVTPVTTASYFLVSYAVRSTSPTAHSKHSSRKWRRRLSLILSLLITLLLIARSILLLYSRVQDSKLAPTKNNVICVLLQTLIWGSLSLLLWNSEQTCWPPFVGTWVVATFLEAAILIASSFTDFGQVGTAQRVLQFIILGALIALSLTGLLVVSNAGSHSKDPESRSLLDPCASSTPADSFSASYQAIDNGDIEPLLEQESDEDSDSASDLDSEDGLLSSENQKRIQHDGGWISYLKQYAIFWPYIWPARNVKLQFLFWILVLNTLAERVLNVLQPRQFGIVIDKLYHSVGSGKVPWTDILLWIVLEFLVSESCGLPALNQILESRISNWSHNQLRIAAFDRVMSLSMSFHDGKDSGEVIKAIEQADSLNSVLRIMILDTMPFALDIIIACWYVTHLLDAYAAVIVLFVAVSFAFATYYCTLISTAARKVSAKGERTKSKQLYEMISNWITVSFFNRKKYEQTRLAKTVIGATKAKQWDNDAAILMFAVQETIEIFGLMLVSLLAAYRIVMGLTPVGNFATIEMYWVTIMFPLYVLGHNYRQLSSDLIDAERLLRLFQQQSSVAESPSARPLISQGGKIEFSHVCFGYDDHKSILKDVSFVAHPGQTIALVGETGSGKSTVLKLLMRYYDPTSGSIKIDDQDIQTLTIDSLRETFGIVPQNAALFNMSILENVRYGRLDATDEEVRRACQAASIHEKILTFPHGYNTKVGERGVKLSGGELQRIAIARVILRNPQIVLLDEATSALDSNTEASIQSTLKSLTTNRTTVVIAHRLSTIMNADLILVLHNGEIVERGTHEELLRLGSRYVESWMRQTRAE